MTKNVEKVIFQKEEPGSGTYRMIIQDEDGTVKKIHEGVIIQRMYDGTHRVMFDGKIENVLMTGLEGIRNNNPGVTIERELSPLENSFSFSNQETSEVIINDPEDPPITDPLDEE